MIVIRPIISRRRLSLTFLKIIVICVDPFLDNIDFSLPLLYQPMGIVGFRPNYVQSMTTCDD